MITKVIYSEGFRIKVWESGEVDEICAFVENLGNAAWFIGYVDGPNCLYMDDNIYIRDLKNILSVLKLEVFNLQAIESC